MDFQAAKLGMKSREPGGLSTKSWLDVGMGELEEELPTDFGQHLVIDRISIESPTWVPSLDPTGEIPDLRGTWPSLLPLRCLKRKLCVTIAVPLLCYWQCYWQLLASANVQVPGLKFRLPDRLCSSEPVPGGAGNGDYAFAGQRSKGSFRTVCIESCYK